MLCAMISTGSHFSLMILERDQRLDYEGLEKPGLLLQSKPWVRDVAVVFCIARSPGAWFKTPCRFRYRDGTKDRCGVSRTSAQERMTLCLCSGHFLILCTSKGRSEEGPLK